MKILYITNVPIPQNPELDAHFQELKLLMATFNGKLISAFPFDKPSRLVPRSLYGWHNRSEIRRAAKNVDIVHVLSPVLHAYPYMRVFRQKPVVFSSLTPIQHLHPIKYVDRYVVYDRTSYEQLQKGQLPVVLSPPFSQFSRCDLPAPEGPFTLLMASAPWVGSQFETKGVNMLISLLAAFPQLRLIFIWRGLLVDEMQRLVQQSGHQDRIELINETVNIEQWLKKSHAVVLLAQYSSLVKSYPHSLMEGLLAGRPVITTTSIPMSEEIVENNYGVVLNQFTIDALKTKIADLMDNYSDFVAAVKSLPPDRFKASYFLDCYDNLYRQLKTSQDD